MPLREIIANELKSTGPISINEPEASNEHHSQQQKSRASKPQQPDQQVDDSNLPTKIYNTKTLQLMSKMQCEFEEKQKRRKLRRTEQLKSQQQLQADIMASSSGKLSKSTSELKSTTMTTTTPKTERKFLTSIINTFFSSSYDAEASLSQTNENSSLQKNETKRLSLRKLKAKNKAKKTGDQNDAEFNQSDSELNSGLVKTASSHSLNIAYSYESNNEDDVVDYAANQPIAAARFGKIKNEDTKPHINENNKENLMKQLKAELDEEIKDRRMLELKNNIINGGIGNNDASESGCGGSSTASSHVSSGEMNFR